MTGTINLNEQLKHYFGFDSFKGEQEAIIRNLLWWQRHLCANANWWRQEPVLSVAVADNGRHGDCDIATNSI